MNIEENSNCDPIKFRNSKQNNVEVFWFLPIFQIYKKAWNVQNHKLQGTGCEMYTETLSSSLSGMSFPQAAE